MSECDLRALLRQAQTTDMENPLANLNFQCTLKVVLCLNPAEDREEQKVSGLLSVWGEKAADNISITS